MNEDTVRSIDSAPSRYSFVSVDVNPDDAEGACSRLFELGATGVEERDMTTLFRGEPGKVTIVASFDSEGDARVALDEMPVSWSPRASEVIGDAWRDEWKKYFEPFQIVEGIVVCPPWRAVEPAPGGHVLLLEPGRAFGTGLHETTSLSAEMLSEFREIYRSSCVLDVGCGSGILGLVALVRGAARVRALDVDVEAVAVTRENSQRNGLMGRLEVDTTPLDRITEVFPAIVANIEAAPLVSLAPALIARLAPGGLVILSGLLAPDVVAGQLEGIRTAYGVLREVEVRRKGEWVAVAFRG
jgi:ribosomal protein L11 methyltransferase